MPHPPNCPTCGQPAAPTAERTLRGVRWAYYLCPNDHPFGMHWLLPAIPVDPPDQEAS